MCKIKFYTAEEAAMWAHTYSANDFKEVFFFFFPGLFFFCQCSHHNFLLFCFSFASKIFFKPFSDSSGTSTYLYGCSLPRCWWELG